MRATHQAVALAAAAAAYITGTTERARVRVTTASSDVLMFNQQDVVDHMIVGDSIEVDAARIAAARTQNAARSVAEMLTIAADSGFDRMFVNQQIQHHQSEISTLKSMRTAGIDLKTNPSRPPTTR